MTLPQGLSCKPQSPRSQLVRCTGIKGIERVSGSIPQAPKPPVGEFGRESLRRLSNPHANRKLMGGIGHMAARPRNSVARLGHLTPYDQLAAMPVALAQCGRARYM